MDKKLTAKEFEKVISELIQGYWNRGDNGNRLLAHIETLQAQVDAQAKVIEAVRDILVSSRPYPVIKQALKALDAIDKLDGVK